MRDERRNLVGGKLNWIFVVHAPVNPFLVINVCKQMQDGPLNILRRRVVLDSVSVGSTKLLVGNMKNEGVIRPQPLVFENEVSCDRSPAVTSEDDRFYFIRRTHNRIAQYLL